MTRTVSLRPAAAAALLALTLGQTIAAAQSRVQYGRITAVTPTTVNNDTARTVGTVVGGTVGLVSGSGQSGSNRALRTVGGAAAGRGVTTLATRSQAFEYTVLVGGATTIRVVSDQAGKRVGDCVAVEQGQFANIRLVADSRCAPPAPRPAAPAPAPAATPAAAAPAATPASAAPAPVHRHDQNVANACEQAKNQVLAAETDEAFDLAERRMRLLCGE